MEMSNERSEQELGNKLAEVFERTNPDGSYAYSDAEVNDAIGLLLLLVNHEAVRERYEVDDFILSAGLGFMAELGLGEESPPEEVAETIGRFLGETSFNTRLLEEIVDLVGVDEEELAAILPKELLASLDALEEDEAESFRLKAVGAEKLLAAPQVGTRAPDGSKNPNELTLSLGGKLRM